METIRVLGIDPGLRYTGIALISYNSETKTYQTSECRILQNKATLKSTAAIKYMVEKLEEVSRCPGLWDAEHFVVESPVVNFNPKFQKSCMILVAHIAGAAAALFPLERVVFYQPSQWNKNKNKEQTHQNTQRILGDWMTWGFKQFPKNIKHIEHVLDAASMALYYIQKNYIEDE